MSLNFNFAKIANFKAVVYEQDPARPETNRIKPLTETLIYGTMLTGIGDLKTDEDCEDYYDRIAAYEKLHGPFLWEAPKDETSPMRPRYITLADVLLHKGLTTNVFPRMSETKFKTQLWDGWRREQKQSRKRATDDLVYEAMEKEVVS